MNNESVDNQVQTLALVGSGNAGFVRGSAAGTSGHDGARAPGGGLPAGTTLTTQEVTDAFESFRAEREEERKADRASLEKLLERDDLDAQTLEDVAAALQRLVTWNEEELALEGALTKSRISPCLAVRSEGMVTVVTKKRACPKGRVRCC